MEIPVWKRPLKNWLKTRPILWSFANYPLAIFSHECRLSVYLVVNNLERWINRPITRRANSKHGGKYSGNWCCNKWFLSSRNRILLATVECGRRRQRPHTLWKDNIKEWTSQSLSSLLRIADNSSRYADITAATGICRNTPTTTRRHGISVSYFFRTRKQNSFQLAQGTTVEFQFALKWYNWQR